MMLRSHIEVARLRRMVRRLFGNVVAASVIRKFPVASKSLPQKGIKWLLDASAVVLTVKGLSWRAEASLRRLDMPPTKVELDHRHESLDGVVNFGHGE
jgi:hypothetical protein